MTITTGSYPAALGGESSSPGDPGDSAMSMDTGRSPTSSPKKSRDSSSYDREFLAGQEKGYSPRKGMAAGIVKC